MLQTPIPFDPWTATAAEAMRAHDEREPGDGTPSPLVQYEAAQGVLRSRTACLAADGGCAVLASLKVCLLHGLQPPRWLSDAFVQRHAQVTDAEVGSWDEAFGAPWPPRTRLDVVRRQRRQRQVVHAAVWNALMADPTLSIGRILFDKLSETLDRGMSGATAERRYYEALDEGAPNALKVRSNINPHANA